MNIQLFSQESQSNKRKGEDTDSAPERQKIKFSISKCIELDISGHSSLSPFQIVMHPDNIKQIFPCFAPSSEEDLFIQVAEKVYKVFENTESVFPGKAFANLPSNCFSSKQFVSFFHSDQVKEPAKQITCRVKIRDVQTISPLPLFIPEIIKLIRKTLDGVFFNSKQKFTISYVNQSESGVRIPLNVSISSIWSSFQSSHVQKIGAETKISIEFPNKFEKLNLIGAFQSYPSKNRNFNFEIVNFINPVHPNFVGSHFFIKEWVRAELRKVLPYTELMIGSSLTIPIEAPFKDYFSPLMQVTLRLLNVKKDEMEEDEDLKTGLYFFKDENYQIDFQETNSKESLNIVEKIVEISTPVKVKVHRWEDNELLTKKGLQIVQLTHKEMLSELWGSLEYLPFNKTRIQTSKGIFLVECSITEQRDPDILYRLQKKDQVKLESIANNLIICDQRIESEKKLFETYLEKQLKSRRIAGLAAKSKEAIIDFIQKTLTFLNTPQQASKVSPLLLISGPSKNGKTFLASFIKDMFTPSSYVYIEGNIQKFSCSSKSDISSPSNPSQEMKISPQERLVTIVRNLDRQKEMHASILKLVQEMKDSKRYEGALLIATTSEIKSIPKDILVEFGINHLELSNPNFEERLEFIKTLLQVETQEELSLKDIDFNHLSFLTKDLPRSTIYTICRLAKEKAQSGKKELTTEHFTSSIEDAKKDNFSKETSQLYS